MGGNIRGREKHAGRGPEELARRADSAQNTAMKISYFDTAAAFLARTGPWLAQREAEHKLMLGIAGNVARRAVAAEGAEVPPERRAMFLLVEDASGILGAGVMTPPYRMVLTALAEPAMRALAADLVKREVKVPGVLAEPRGAAIFGEVYTRGTHLHVTPGRAERLYDLRLQTWRQPEPVPAGEMVRAGPADMPLVEQWFPAFMVDVRDTAPLSEAPNMARNAVHGGRLFLWRGEGQAVAMAAWARPSENGIAINAVYTPPELRRRGYATALVTRLSKYVLTGVEEGGLGKRFCVLYTDLANPISNSIYQKIGYRQVCDLTELDFHR